MRISDWSSDVCSSDLETIPVADFRHLPVAAPYIALMPQWHFLDFVAEAAAHYPGFTLRREAEAVATIETAGRTTGVRLASGDEVQARLVIAADGRHSVLRAQSGLRSEEQTSELQSLMRISYAVFCLKK